MSKDAFDEKCAGCQPVLVDLTTKKPMPPNEPPMLAIMAVWKELTHEERVAYHNVCCKNSREARDLALAGGVAQRMQGVLKLLEDE